MQNIFFDYVIFPASIGILILILVSIMSKQAKPKQASRPSTLTRENILEFFRQFADPDDTNRINIEGISRLADAIGIPIDDVKLLALMWKLGAKEKPASINEEEFVNGCMNFNGLSSASVDAFKSVVSILDPGFLEGAEFKDLYKFCFKFNLLESTHKYIEKEIALALLPVILDINRAPHLNYFMEFLQQNTKISRVTLDEWDQFYDFNCRINIDLSNYDADSSAYPVLIDEYVEYRKKA